MAADPQHVETVFSTALSKATPSERAAYLDRVCAEDHELRCRVESLLRAHEEAGSFLDRPLLEPEATAMEQPGAERNARDSEPETPMVDIPATNEPDLDFLGSTKKPGCLGTLGPYAITEVVGHGGMGVVLKGHDTKLNRVVAIKVLAPELASNATARQRFHREAQAAAAIAHPHVVTIHAVDEADRLPYLVMEYVDGVSLGERIERDGPLELREILRIGWQVASGLAAAHGHGLIHRDVKPSNVLLENGVERAKLTDFGLARAVDDIGMTRTGEVAGTPPYMAPEQAQGAHVDHRSDLFSFGCLLYAMGAGRSPFRAETSVAALRRVCDDSPRPIREINPDIPEWLVELIEKLLAKNPDERFQSAEEVADLLGRHLAALQHPLPEQIEASPGGARSSGSDGPASARARRLRRRWMAAIALAVLLGGLGLSETAGVTQVADFVATVLRIRTPQGTLVVRVDDPQVEVAIEGDGGLLISGAGPQEVRLKPGKYRLKASKDGRPVHRELVSIRRGDREVVNVRLERNSATAAETVEDSETDGAEDRSRPPETITEVGRIEGHEGNILAIAFEPDGRRVLSGAGDQTVRLWDVSTTEELHRFTGHEAPVFAVAVSPAGALAASADQKGTVRLWDLEAGREVGRFNACESLVSGLAFLPDGRRLVSAGHDRTLRLWSVPQGRKLREFPPLEGDIHRIAVSPDGARCGVARWGGVSVWDLQQGERLWKARGAGRGNYCIAFSPDGRYVATGCAVGDTCVQLWDSRTGEEIRRFEGHARRAASVGFSPDGRHVISGSSDRTLRIWSVDSSEQVGFVRCDNHVTSNVAISRDGRLAVSGGGVYRDDEGNFQHDGDYALRLWRLPESVWPKGKTSPLSSSSTMNSTEAPLPGRRRPESNETQAGEQPMAPPLPEPNTTDN